ncbi:MAG: hypothetical protein IKQ70_16625 [Bacteroidales bacterium]|nr:hypothetical protein [Bacteroidales bacterium]
MIGSKIYPSIDNKDDRMEIDFLIRKNKVTSRHNIVPLEVKSSQRYTLSSLKKCIEKYNNYITSPCVVHTADLKEENGILFLPLYMTGLL